MAEVGGLRLSPPASNDRTHGSRFSAESCSLREAVIGNRTSSADRSETAERKGLLHGSKHVFLLVASTKTTRSG
ncbi:hypothetical protein AS026_21875 [Rhizobium altiplani]|uniref:Uncharacterized protein n=1 Tax=Rhizobium altiplani TaxID=1864509 RepID=A0A109J3T7_9HYPH|nr:hypothetical protein AS026_21875 [Rhizobium altiplani]